MTQAHTHADHCLTIPADGQLLTAIILLCQTLSLWPPSLWPVLTSRMWRSLSPASLWQWQVFLSMFINFIHVDSTQNNQ